MFFSIQTYGQLEVEFNEIKGLLSLGDKYSKDFGRYDGFEIPLYEGELVNFIVYSEKFFPKIIFVNPSGKIYKQSIEAASSVASMVTSVDEAGDWILYVVGDSAAVGDYVFQYAFASKNALEYNESTDFCTSLNFITTHAKAYFLLIQNVIVPNGTFVKLKDAVDAFIDESDGSYSAQMYEGNSLSEAEKIYNNYSSQITKCLGNNYSKKTESWVNIEDYKIKSTLLTENVKEKERLVLVSIKDVSKSKLKFTGNYVVQILVSRKN